MGLAGALATAAGAGLQLALPAAHPLVLGLETLLPFGVVYFVAASALGERVGF